MPAPTAALAEDVVIDLMSNGRFDFGVGVGSQFEEFRTFRLDPKERNGRSWEAIDLIRRCFTEMARLATKASTLTCLKSHLTKPVQADADLVGWHGSAKLAKAANAAFLDGRRIEKASDALMAHCARWDAIRHSITSGR